jgi:hypothetical protein
MLHNAELFTRLYNVPHFASLSADSLVTEQPPHIKVGLRSHQAAVIERMISLEKNLREGYDICGEKLYSRFGVLGD